MATHHLTDPSDIVGATFDTSWRGFDQDEVRAYLRAVAERLSEALDRIEELERAAARADTAPAEHTPDATELNRLLGEETARVLDVANEAAAAQRERAAAEAEETVAAAERRATELESEAEKRLADATSEAEQRRDEIVAAAEQQRASVQEHYDNELERARLDGERILSEARAARDNLLEELADERYEIRGQIEQLRAGRDALLAALQGAGGVIDEMFDDLADAMPNARRIAESAALRVRREPVSLSELSRYSAGDTGESSDDDDVSDDGPADDSAGVAVGELDREFGPAASERDDDATETESESGESNESVSLTLIEGSGGEDGLDELFERLRTEGDDDTAPDDDDVVADEAAEMSDEDDAGSDEVEEEAEPGDDEVIDLADSDEPDEDVAEEGPSPEELAYEKAVNELASALKSELADEQNDLLDALRQGDGDLEYPSPDAQRERYLEVAADLAGDDANDVVESVVSQLQRRVPPVLAEPSADAEEMSERVRSIYREVRTRRIDQAVRQGLHRQPA